MVRISERQMQINSQIGDDMVDLKTQQLFTGQALGVLEAMLGLLVERAREAQLLKPGDDKRLQGLARALDLLRKNGLHMAPPEDPQARVPQVTCPSCQAKIKVKPGERARRCDWCGHVFSEVVE
jgi:hypothetical protein